jgi:hypothetical protein
MAATFEKAFNMMGFDKDATPRWQMVPQGGVRYMALREGAGLTVTSADTSVLTVKEIAQRDIPIHFGERMPLHHSDRIFELRSVKKGNTKVQAKNAAATVVVELEVDVKGKKTVRTTFNFVSDNAGHRTNRAPASAVSWVNTMNYIYNGQANIVINLLHTRKVAVTQDLGPQVMWTSTAPNEWDTVTALGDAGADMNYFLVWEYEQDATPTIDDADAGTVANNCIFEDHAGQHIGVTMGHEMGHHLGRPDLNDSALWNHLMYGTTDERGTHLSKDDVNTMNP